MQKKEHAYQTCELKAKTDLFIYNYKIKLIRDCYFS